MLTLEYWVMTPMKISEPGQVPLMESIFAGNETMSDFCCCPLPIEANTNIHSVKSGVNIAPTDVTLLYCTNVR